MQHEVKPSAVIGWRPTPKCYTVFFILYEHGGILTAFLVNKSFILATFSDSKLVTHVTNSAVFSVCSAVFSIEFCKEKIALLLVWCSPTQKL